MTELLDSLYLKISKLESELAIVKDKDTETTKDEDQNDQLDDGDFNSTTKDQINPEGIRNDYTKNENSNLDKLTLNQDGNVEEKVDEGGLQINENKSATDLQLLLDDQKRRIQELES